MLTITLKQGKEKPVLAGQRWIYASAIERVDGRPNEKMSAGITAVVQSSSTQFLGRAAYNSRSQIRARIWSVDPAEAVDHAMIKRRVQAAVAKYAVKHAVKHAVEHAVEHATKPARSIALVEGEEAGLSGLSVEWHGGRTGFLICAFHAAGVDAWKVPIVQALIAATGCPNVYECCDPLLRKGEGLPVLSGVLAGEEPPEEFRLAPGERQVRAKGKAPRS